MDFFGSSGGGGKVELDSRELRHFQKQLADYANSLRQLDANLKKALDQLGQSYRDTSYRTFRGHVETALFKQHQEELTRIEALIRHVNKLATQIEQVKATAGRSPF